MFISLVIGRIILAIMLVAEAAYLLNQGKDGWGWCLFFALCFGGLSISKETK